MSNMMQAQSLQQNFYHNNYLYLNRGLIQLFGLALCFIVLGLYLNSVD